MAKLTTEERANDAISHALGMREALALSNYHAFFQLYQTAPNMAPYILDLFVDRQRLLALRTMVKAYRPSIDIEFVQAELAFPSKKECIRFLKDHGAVLTADKKEIDTRATLPVLAKSVISTPAANAEAS